MQDARFAHVLRDNVAKMFIRGESCNIYNGAAYYTLPRRRLPGCLLCRTQPFMGQDRRTRIHLHKAVNHIKKKI